MATTRRERQRQNTIDEIKAIARQHMAEQGAFAISLRAIAREMGVTVTALYRYFPSYDDLITELIVDAFNALADALESAPHGIESQDFRARLKSVMMCYRQWAITNSADFILIYGTPIPNYHAPRDLTVPIVVRGFLAIGQIVADAHRNGKLNSEAFLPIPASIDSTLQQLIAEYHYDTQAVVIYITNILWTRGHGIIMLELFNHLGPSVGDTHAFYEAEVERLLNSLGL